MTDQTDERVPSSLERMGRSGHVHTPPRCSAYTVSPTMGKVGCDLKPDHDGEHVNGTMRWPVGDSDVR